MIPKYSKIFGVCLICLITVGCQGGRSNVIPEQTTTLQAEPNPVIEPKSKQVKNTVVEKLISRAEAAMLQGRLTQPTHDNAFDRFSAVLMLEPDNESARQGMDRIQLALVARVHQALKSGRISTARRLTGIARSHFPDHQLTRGLSAAVAQAEQELELAVTQDIVVTANDDSQISLPTSMLNSRSQTLVQLLSEVTQRLQETNEGVLIYARTDAEGRWIYQTMKKAAGDYRVRGDIHKSRRPRLVFLKPFLDSDGHSPEINNISEPVTAYGGHPMGEVQPLLVEGSAKPDSINRDSRPLGSNAALETENKTVDEKGIPVSEEASEDTFPLQDSNLFNELIEVEN